MATGETTDALRGLQERSLTLLRAIATHIPDGCITVVDAELNTLLSRGPLFQRLDYPAFEGKRVAEGWPVELQNVATERFRAALAGEVQSFQLDVEALTVWSRYVPLYDEQGHIFAAMNLTLDVTAQHRSELLLREAQERVHLLSSQLQSALEASEMGAWVYDLHTQLMWGNDTQRALWGIPADTAEWFPASMTTDSIHPDDRERAAQEANRTISDGHAMSLELRFVRPDGEVRWIATRGRLERDADGKPLKLLGVHYDITNQKRADEALARSQKLEALGTLSSGIAHDFNNILQAITGNAAMGMYQLAEDHPARLHVSEIARAAARATDLVRQILTFTRPQEQKRKVLGLRPIIDEALRLVRATLPPTIEIETELDPAAPDVFADPSEVHQVLVNLATNAAHAIGKRQGAITVSLRRQPLADGDLTCVTAHLPAGLYAELEVQDDGCGMDRATLSRIFDPFFTTKPVGEGTGLGLSVVHGIVRSLHGGVTVSSQPGLGTSFHLYLPAAARQAPSSTSAAPRSPRGQGQRILFVDDEPALTLMGKHMLAHLGYEAEVYNDPEAAMAAFAADPARYALVITDLSMPVMNGFQLTSQLRRLRPDVPVLVTSGYARTEEQDQARQLAVRELLLKPVSMERLAEALSLALA